MTYLDSRSIVDLKVTTTGERWDGDEPLGSGVWYIKVVRFNHDLPNVDTDTSVKIFTRNTARLRAVRRIPQFLLTMRTLRDRTLSMDRGLTSMNVSCSLDHMELPPAYCSARYCSASALVIVYKGDLFLDFCGHHFNKYRPVLLLDGFEVIEDERLQGQRFESSFDDAAKGVARGVSASGPTPTGKTRPA